MSFGFIQFEFGGVTAPAQRPPKNQYPPKPTTKGRGGGKHCFPKLVFFVKKTGTIYEHRCSICFLLWLLSFGFPLSVLSLPPRLSLPSHRLKDSDEKERMGGWGRSGAGIEGVYATLSDRFSVGYLFSMSIFTFATQLGLSFFLVFLSPPYSSPLFPFSNRPHPLPLKKMKGE
eukprot:Hpha_TRINITY_DN15917_c5_g3::TRINITY_DN15917_c5_g3_i4::g.74892::m.74892